MAPFQQQDGLLFLNREAHYDLGSSPLALLWKDAHSSRYFLDTDAAGVVPDWLHIVLQCLDNGHVGTGDDPPIIVGTVPQDLLQNKPDQSRCVPHLQLCDKDACTSPCVRLLSTTENVLLECFLQCILTQNPAADKADMDDFFATP